MSVSWTDSALLCTPPRSSDYSGSRLNKSEHCRETFMESWTEGSAIPAGKRLLLLKEMNVVEGLQHGG